MLEHSTEGWIAGLQMAGLSLQGRENASAFIRSFSGVDRHILDFLFEEVFQRQPEEIQRFLLQSSILGRISAPLCDAVVLRADSQFILDTLERSNLFLISLDEQRKWYRYHHLFSDLLRLMLEKAHPGLSVQLHRRACLWYEAQGMISEALDHALSSGDMQLVAQIVSGNVLVLLETNEIQPTLAKIDSLPIDKVTEIPWLGIARAWVMGPGQFQKSQQILDAIEKNITNEPVSADLQRLKGHIAAARAFVLGAQEDEAIVLRYAKDANELLPPEDMAVRAMNLMSWANRLVANENNSSAMPILKQAMTLALQATKPHIAMIAASELATAHLFGGRLHELHRVCLEALSISEDYEKCYQYPLVATGEIYTLLARGYAEWGENENAIQIARKGLLLCEQWGRFSGEQLARLYLGRALVLANHWEEALHEFEGAEQSAKKISSIVWQRDALYILDSVLDCEAIDATKIEQILQRLQSSGAHLPAMLNARLLLRDKQPDMVLSTLDKALAELGTEPSFDRVRIHALRALAFNVKGDKERAMTELQKALELGEPENRVATFVREGAAMEKLLRVALARGICSEFVQRLLNAFEARRKPEPTLDPGYTINKDIRSGEENMAEPLTERELEILRLLNSHLSTPEIADMLAVSVNTVRTHIKSIYSKLGVHSRSTAIDVSKKLKLLA
jgi:LuxR family maltose regulon positive regulatory protein